MFRLIKTKFWSLMFLKVVFKPFFWGGADEIDSGKKTRITIWWVFVRQQDSSKLGKWRLSWSPRWNLWICKACTQMLNGKAAWAVALWQGQRIWLLKAETYKQIRDQREVPWDYVKKKSDCGHNQCPAMKTRLCIKCPLWLWQGVKCWEMFRHFKC